MTNDGRSSRRGFFRLGLRKAIEAAADTVEGVGKELQARYRGKERTPTPSIHDHAPIPLVHMTPPPGAVPDFAALCTKCDDCVAACPAWAIRKAEDHEPQAGYPLLEPNTTACALCDDPLPCIEVCEPGALLPIPRESVRLGLALLDLALCVVPSGETCSFCVDHCPVAEQAIRMSEDGPVISEEGCTGCGLCVPVCPTDALEIIPHPLVV